MANAGSSRCHDLDYAVSYMLDSDNSDIDSSHGGLDSDLEEELDNALLGFGSDYDETDTADKKSDTNVVSASPSPPPTNDISEPEIYQTLHMKNDDDATNPVELTLFHDQQSNTFLDDVTAAVDGIEIVLVDTGDLLQPATSTNNVCLEKPIPTSTNNVCESSSPDEENLNAFVVEIKFVGDEDVHEHIKNYKPENIKRVEKNPFKRNPSRKKSVTEKPIKQQPAKKKKAKCGEHDKTTPGIKEKSYDDPDIPNALPEFKPQRDPGIYCDVPLCRGVKDINFFQLFFTEDIIKQIAEHTNTYAWMNITKKKTVAKKDGSWMETTVTEIKQFISLILYMGIGKVPRHDRYWSTKTLFHGLWARSMLSRNRFFALLSMLHVVDPKEEVISDKLKKVSPSIDHFRIRCLSLFQPEKNLAIDERLVKSKHRSGIRQYIKNKPVKFGIKLWVIADSATGYTCDFSVYTGSGDGVVDPDHGLGYGVVMTLSKPFLNQGYHLFFDNFYTSKTLVTDLFEHGTPSCGTAVENRRGFPESMKGGKSWVKGKPRGAMRWNRDDKTLCLQWKDNKVVTMVSSIDRADKFVEVERKVKSDGEFSKVVVKQPECIQRYNRYMNGVDKSDQHLAKYNLLRKCVRWWKTLFFHLVDIAVVNGFILFQKHRSMNPCVQSLIRPKSYALLDFRKAVIRQLADLEEYAEPPVFKNFQVPVDARFHTKHIPVATDVKRNCIVCFMTLKKEMKVRTKCTAPQCNVFLHIREENNCFEKWHTSFEH